MRRVVPSLFAAMALLSLPLASHAAVKPVYNKGTPDYAESKNEFTSAVVMDAKTGKILYWINPTQVWPAASLTKLMTSLVFLKYRPAWGATISLKASDEVGGGRLRLPTGARMTVRDMFYSAIVGSANNAAMAMARSTGYSLAGFARQMNRESLAIGLSTSTHFVEPSGMDKGNVSTALDLAKLARYAFSNPDIALAGRTKSYDFPVANPAVEKYIHNTNTLLTNGRDDMKVLDGKTGFIYESMYNFILEAEPPNADANKKLIVVVLGAPDTADSQQSAAHLADWAWQAYTWK